MQQRLRYWIYTGTPNVAMIHRSDCGHCNDGKGQAKKAGHIADLWYGFYPTKGTAIDAGVSLGGDVVEDVCMNWPNP